VPGAMVRYRLKTPIGAMFHKPGGGLVRVTLPAGAILVESSRQTTTVLGMVGVLCEGQHYSVGLNDLRKNAERLKGD
jgi:hypothetical protein